ncbi:MAG TPA: hypothetical protein VFI43_09260 [Nitrosospira sp.]|nr:hypothetical protein [Nitrosospira sp.]
MRLLQDERYGSSRLSRKALTCVFQRAVELLVPFGENQSLLSVVDALAASIPHSGSQANPSKLQDAVERSVSP